MKHCLSKLLILTLAVSIASVVSPVQAQVANLSEIQQAAVGLTAMPPRLGDDGSLKADPGETIQTQVRVRNTTNRVLKVSTLVEDFIIGDDGRTPQPVVTNPDSRWSLAQWIELPETQATLQPGGVQNIPVIIRVPENAYPGGRYAMIMHEPSEQAVSQATGETVGQTGVQQRVGTLVYLQVNGDVKEQAFIRNLSAPRLMEFGPVPLSFDVENLSDIHIRPQTSVVVRDMFGFEKDRIGLEPQNIFPYTNRSFKTEWDKVWGFGRYSARVSVTYGQSGQTTEALTHFWVVPVKLLLALGVVLLAAVGIAVSVRRHLRHKDTLDQQHISLLEDRIRQLETELHDEPRK